MVSRKNVFSCSAVFTGSPFAGLAVLFEGKGVQVPEGPHSGALLAKTHSIAYSLMQGLEEIAKESSLPLVVRGVPPVFHLSFLPEGSQPVVDYRTALQSDTPQMRIFWMALQERGIRITPEGLCFVSTAHTEKDVEETLAAVKEALDVVA